MRAVKTHCISIIGLLVAFLYILCGSATGLSVMEAVYIGTIVALAVCSMATTKYQNKEK
jgi:glycerol uptake facilitator-like aquaporin